MLANCRNRFLSNTKKSFMEPKKLFLLRNLPKHLFISPIPTEARLVAPVVNPSMQFNVNKSCIPKKAQSYLICVLNIFYYLALVPFKIKTNSSTCGYKKYTFQPQRYLCGFVSFILAIFLLFIPIDGIVHLVNRSEGNASLIVAVFETVSNVGSFLMALSIYNIVWRKSETLLKILGNIEPKYLSLNRKAARINKVNQKLSVNFISTVVTLLVLTLTAIVTVLWISNTDFYKDISTLVKLVKSSTILRITMYIVFVYIGFIFVLGHGLVLCTALDLNSFVDSLMPDELYSKFNIMRHFNKNLEAYQRTRETTNLVQSSMGGLLFSTCLASVSYYAQSYYVWMGYRGEPEKLVLLVFGFSTLIWIIAAEFHFKVKEY